MTNAISIRDAFDNVREISNAYKAVNDLLAGNTRPPSENDQLDHVHANNLYSLLNILDKDLNEALDKAENACLNIHGIRSVK